MPAPAATTSAAAPAYPRRQQIVADPGLAARRADLDPLAERGSPRRRSHVFLSHHHPDHTLNAGLFPNAWVIDFWGALPATSGSTTAATMAPRTVPSSG
jgi:glyoxylase-like metal-dependent hydrolase (beta-lactamase superfamily II)